MADFLQGTDEKLWTSYMMSICGKHEFYDVFAFSLGGYPGFLGRIGLEWNCAALVLVFTYLSPSYKLVDVRFTCCFRSVETYILELPGVTRYTQRSKKFFCVYFTHTF